MTLLRLCPKTLERCFYSSPTPPPQASSRFNQCLGYVHVSGSAFFRKLLTIKRYNLRFRERILQNLNFNFFLEICATSTSVLGDRKQAVGLRHYRELTKRMSNDVRDF